MSEAATSEGVGAESDVERKHAELMRRIRAAHPKISERASIWEEAQAGKRLSNSRTQAYTFAAVALLAGLLILSQRYLELPQQLLPYNAFLVFWALLLIAAASALRALWVALGLFRPPLEAAFGMESRHRITLFKLVTRIRRFERRYSEELGRRREDAKRERGSYPVVPPHIRTELANITTQIGQELRTLDQRYSLSAAAERGQRIERWQAAFTLAFFVFVTAVISAVLYWLVWASPFREVLPAAPSLMFTFLGVLTALVTLILPTTFLYLDRGFGGEAEATRLVRLARLSREQQKQRDRVYRINPETAADASVSLEEVLSEGYEESAPEQTTDLRQGLLDDLREKKEQANVQVGFGAALACVGILLLFFSFLDIQAEYRRRSGDCPGAWSVTLCAGSSGQPAQAAPEKLRQESYAALLVTKLTIAIGLNALAFFFLIGFRKSQADAKFLRNELTTLDIRLYAFTRADTYYTLADKDAQARSLFGRTLTALMAQLGATERNPVLPDGATNANVQELLAATSELRALAGLLRAESASAAIGQATANSTP
jgi:hypothetical protein